MNVCDFLIHLWIKSFHNTEPVGTFRSILIHSHHSDVSQINYCFLSRFKNWASCHNWYLNFSCILSKDDANLLNSPDTVQSLSSLQDKLVQRHSINTMDTDVPHGQVNLNSFPTKYNSMYKYTKKASTYKILNLKS